MYKTLFLAFLLSIALFCAVVISVLTVEAGNGWTKETYKKLETMQKIGFDKKLATYVINGCKRTAIDPESCVIVASFTGKAESNAGQNAYMNNVWGINEGKTYKSKEENFDRWLMSYNIWWYKSPLPEHYYPPKGQVSKTRYCTDEHSSKSAIGCPNGLRIATQTFNFFQ